MYYLYVTQGVHEWLVFLASEEDTNWPILKSFPNRELAREFANSLTNLTVRVEDVD